MEQHVKKLLPSGDYHAIIREARKSDNNKYLELVYTIDVGEYSYRNVIIDYKLNDFGLSQLKNRLDEIGYFILTDPEHEYFYNQFIGIRSKIKVDRLVSGKVIKNVITEMMPPTQEKEWNVLKPKTEEFYYREAKGRSLPIDEKQLNYEQYR